MVDAKDGCLEVVLDELSSYLDLSGSRSVDTVGYACPSKSSPHLNSFKDASMNLLKALKTLPVSITTLLSSVLVIL